MAFTTSQLINLESAIAQGVLQVQFGDRRIVYHSLDEMIRLRDSMRSELGVPLSTGSRSRFITLATGKGL